MTSTAVPLTAVPLTGLTGRALTVPGLGAAAHDGEPAQLNCGAAAVGRVLTPAGSVPCAA